MAVVAGWLWSSVNKLAAGALVGSLDFTAARSERQRVLELQTRIEILGGARGSVVLCKHCICDLLGTVCLHTVSVLAPPWIQHVNSDHNEART